MGIAVGFQERFVTNEYRYYEYLCAPGTLLATEGAVLNKELMSLSLWSTLRLIKFFCFSF